MNGRSQSSNPGARQADTSPKAALQQRGLRAKRHFGQNFLTDPYLAERIAQLATTPPGGTVVEVGAGLGALTRPLLASAQHVVAIERDRDLIPMLQDMFQQELTDRRLAIEQADAKTIDLTRLLHTGPAPRVLAGNLPYAITGPLLQRAVEVAPSVERVVFLTQLEVAERLTARPGTPEYGALSVFVQARFEHRRALVLRPGSFYPSPAVDSAVLVLHPRLQPLARETPTFRQLVAAAFTQRRKTLRNAWQRQLDRPAASITRAATRAGIDLGRRGETLDIAEFQRMANALDETP